MDLNEIKNLPCGARFFRCALQVNTYDYVVRHKHPTAYADENYKLLWRNELHATQPGFHLLARVFVQKLRDLNIK
jgi:hypothetical protein